jgi:hypothetical protein
MNFDDDRLFRALMLNSKIGQNGMRGRPFGAGSGSRMKPDESPENGRDELAFPAPWKSPSLRAGSDPRPMSPISPERVAPLRVQATGK